MLWIKNYIDKLSRHATKRYRRRGLDKVRNIVVHCTVPFVESPEQIAEYDTSPFYTWPDGVRRQNKLSATGAPGCSYHYLIDSKGVIYQALNLNEVSWHAPPLNTTSVAIGLMFDPTDSDGRDRGNVGPSPEMYEAAIQLCAKLCELKSMLPKVNSPEQIFGHREILGSGCEMVNGVKKYKKSCPGWSIDMDQLRDDVYKEIERGERNGY